MRPTSCFSWHPGKEHSSQEGGGGPHATSITPHETRLAELLAELDLSQADLARRSRTSLTTVARATTGAQISAEGRAKIIMAIHRRRQELQQSELAATAIFPTG